MHKALSIIKQIMVWLVVLLAVCMMIFTVISVRTFDRNDRKIFGYGVYIVMSDSMSKTDFDAGDLVLVKEVDPQTLAEGDIIAFISRDEESYGQTVTHKIRKIVVNEQGEPGFLTYGTTTDTDDSVIVTYSDILGQYQFRIPKMGNFFHFLKSIPGYIICILLPFLILLIYQGVQSVGLFRKYRAEQLDDLKQERAEMERERAEHAKVLAELKALQTQIQQASVQETETGNKQEVAGEDKV